MEWTDIEWPETELSSPSFKLDVSIGWDILLGATLGLFAAATRIS